MNRLWVLSDSKKALFWKKSPFSFFIRMELKSFFLLSDFCTLFAKKRTFCCYPTVFIESLITHKQLIFEESYISYGKRQKSCTLIVIWVKCLYLTSPTFNLTVKSNRILFIANEEVILYKKDNQKKQDIFFTIFSQLHAWQTSSTVFAVWS